jgi:hypothetical protein
MAPRRQHWLNFLACLQRLQRAVVYLTVVVYLMKVVYLAKAVHLTWPHLHRIPAKEGRHKRGLTNSTS